MGEALGDQKDREALQAALRALLAPLTRLAVSQGVTVQELDALLRQAIVDAAVRSLTDAGLPPNRLVSRISTVTGLTRREVTRLTTTDAASQGRAGGSLASEVFTRWVTDKRLRSAKGEILPLKRVGDAPSFEALARSVTQDVHPRSLLDELCRLGMAELDGSGETVRLLRDAFVPDRDKQHMLGFLGDNVGDHFSGAVSNVIGDRSRQHLDQAVFADELSAESLEVVHQFALGQWQRLLREAVPMLEQRIEDDKQAGRMQDRRVRIGMYSYADTMVAATPAVAKTGSAPSKKGTGHE